MLELIWKRHEPIGAYDLLDELRALNRRAAPPTIYRALEFLMDQGLVHRIESLNAYIGCTRPEHEHAGQFLPPPPVCTDCHGIHTIKAPKDANSSVAAANVKNTCASCHEGVRLSKEFGVPSGRVSSYLASYHGMASEVGSNTVANCASCHGVHNILPSADPRSTINHANLAKTCGQCHPGANDKFVTTKVHLDATSRADVGSKIIGLIKKFYLWMIFAVIGGMVLHNLIVFRKKLILHRIGQPLEAKPEIALDGGAFR